MSVTVGLRHAAIGWIVLVGAIAGCVRSGSSHCGDMTCPPGRACAMGRCVDEALATACSRQHDGDGCTVSTFGNGTCKAGLCIVGICGDGAINAVDACDGQDLGGKTCLDFGSSYPEGLKCAADCSFDTSGCKGYCGDGMKQSNEECDGKQFGGKTCITEGFYGGKLVCTVDCKINLGSCTGRCGDGIRNSFTEQCDGADLGSAATNTCEARGFHGAVQPLLCTSTCSFDPSSCSCGGVQCAHTEQCALIDNIYSCVPYP
jgi:hypothetical protein